MVVKNQYLSKLIAGWIYQHDNPAPGYVFYTRIHKDSSSGSKFEDHLADIVGWYLHANPNLYFDKSSKCKFKITVNDPIKIGTSPISKKVDLVISDSKSGFPICLFELKKTLAKGSLKRTMAHDNWFQFLQKDQYFRIIIFDCSSGKVEAYKKIPECRVIAPDFKKIGKSENVKIFDSVESILEEMHEHLRLYCITSSKRRQK